MQKLIKFKNNKKIKETNKNNKNFKKFDLANNVTTFLNSVNYF